MHLHFLPGNRWTWSVRWGFFCMKKTVKSTDKSAGTSVGIFMYVSGVNIKLKTKSKEKFIIISDVYASTSVTYFLLSVCIEIRRGKICELLKIILKRLYCSEKKCVANIQFRKIFPVFTNLSNGSVNGFP